MRKRYSALFLAVSLLSAVASAALFAASSKERQRVYGLTVHDASAPHARAAIRGARTQAEKLGAELAVLDAGGDASRQLEQLEALLARGADGLIFGGSGGAAALAPAIRAFNERGIPVVALEPLPEGGKADLRLEFDAAGASREAARLFAARLQELHGADPRGVVLEIAGDPADPFTAACAAGFHSVLDGFGGIRVARAEGGGENGRAFRETAGLLARHGRQVLGIYVHTPDTMAAGVVKALEQARLDPADYSLSGVRLGPEGRDLAGRGKLYAAVGQPSMEAGMLAVGWLWALDHGRPVPGAGDVVRQEGALWSPAGARSDPRGGGVVVELRGAVVPLEVAADDPRLWENVLGR